MWRYGKKSDLAEQPTTVEEEMQEDAALQEEPEEVVEAAVEAAEGTLKMKECTYLNPTPDSRYMIDMVEYPDWDSGMGKLEKLDDDGSMYLGVSNYSSLTTMIFEGADLEKVSSITDVPEVMAAEIAANFNEAKMYMGGSLIDHTYGGWSLEYSKIEDLGEVNGYPMCHYVGDFVIDEKGTELRFPVYGYTTFLKQSGYPIYVSTIDVSETGAGEEQLKKLDEIAYNCIQTLREVTEEDIRAMGW